jgi:hypothetical protein
MKRQVRRSTMLELVRTIQDSATSDEEVVAIIAHMLKTRRVVLCGIFAGRRLTTAAGA